MYSKLYTLIMMQMSYICQSIYHWWLYSRGPFIYDLRFCLLLHKDYHYIPNSIFSSRYQNLNTCFVKKVRKNKWHKYSLLNLLLRTKFKQFYEKTICEDIVYAVLRTLETEWFISVLVRLNLVKQCIDT